MKNLQGRKRVIIENVKPEIECGEFPVKRVVGERVIVSADIFSDGHDIIKASLLYRQTGMKEWLEARMIPILNDHWEGAFIPDSYAQYEYTVQGWIDHFATWQHDLKKKFEANQDVKVELLIGAGMMEEALEDAENEYKAFLQEWIAALKDPGHSASAVSLALSQEAIEVMEICGNRFEPKFYSKILRLEVEREKALFSTWYELFPRSATPEKGKHGTFKDVEQLLPEIARMGFDVLYFPPIHPIGKSFRKGLNNATSASPGDPGSPWAIGAEEGGHKAIHPELGSLNDFKSLVEKAKGHQIDIALDLALQCSPDHPYVKEHPQWFKWRPDGTVQYAENPPKKYQDILPIYFETEDWENLWRELKSIVDYWIGQGIHIFRVDNPHTKPFAFWEWLIREVRKDHPDTIFLAEAFTRPRIMERLAKIGFTQSYTYFTWRNNSEEFIQYLTELTKTGLRDYFRPNFWPNTPDILPISLERKEEPAFICRLILAATLSSSYGIYGPIFEFGLNEPYPGKEEYIDSEKYEIKHWDWNKQTKTKNIITRINQIRKENKALQSTWHIHFAASDNPQLLCYAKTDQDLESKMLMVVNLDPIYVQSGWIKVPLEELELTAGKPYIVHDLISGNKYTWQNDWNYVELHPGSMPAHVFRIEPTKND